MCHYAGTMTVEFQDVMCAFLTTLLKQCNKLQEDSRLSAAVFSCLNAFLLKFGLDNFSRVLTIHTGMTNLRQLYM